ncbi:MAG: acyl-CoA dehydrogenase, partial [Caulobacteraceae bacterium]|nr:acyl-CoA dehydrogenase [Caulobacteraceae bacterium]
LPPIASGDTIAALAFTEPSGKWDAAGIMMEATAEGDHSLLSGEKMFVIDGNVADVIVVVARTAGTTGTDGISFFTVSGNAKGLTRTALSTMDMTRKQSKLEFDKVVAEPLGAPGSGWPAFSKTLDQAAVALSNEMMGGAQKVLEMSVEYAKVRVQFGRPIGSFQAVKHLCAEMAAELEPCRALVWYAAHAADALPAEAPLAAAHAKAHLSEVSRFVARSAIEVHGGYGFADLSGLHFWFKRVGLDRQLLGGPERIRAVAAAMQGLAASTRRPPADPACMHSIRRCRGTGGNGRTSRRGRPPY